MILSNRARARERYGSRYGFMIRRKKKEEKREKKGAVRDLRKNALARRQLLKNIYIAGFYAVSRVTSRVAVSK
jgi:hypothetical protein